MHSLAWRRPSLAIGYLVIFIFAGRDVPLSSSTGPPFIGLSFDIHIHIRRPAVRRSCLSQPGLGLLLAHPCPVSRADLELLELTPLAQRLRPVT